MSKASLALVAVVVVLTATFAPSLIVRAQGSTRFEYIRVTPYAVHIPVGPNAVQDRTGYRACVAGNSEWACREFPPAESSTDALRRAFVNLGNDGWEMVSAVEEDPNWSGIHGLTYFFKRQIR